MLTVAAPSGSGGTRAAVTDGGGGADMLRASSRLIGVNSGRPGWVHVPHRGLICALAQAA
jgi:hypothetical protein